MQNLSSYSFRRVVPTLAGIVRLTDTERLAIGQWTDAASGSSTAQTPLRYDAQKQKQGHQFRLAAALFLASAPEVLWEEIKTTSAVERWTEAMVAADELLSESPRVVRLSSEDVPGMPMVKSLLPASLAVIRTAGKKIIRALRKRAAATALPGPSSSPSMPKPTVSPRLAPKQDEPPLQRRRLPQKTAALAAPEQVSPAPMVLPVPASPAAAAPPAPARGPGTPAVAVKKKPQPPAAKARSPPPPLPLNEVSDAMFDIAARERWDQPGHSGKPEPPTLVFWGADGHGSLYLAGLPKEPPLGARQSDWADCICHGEDLAEWHSGIVFSCRVLCRTRARNVIRPCKMSNKRPSLPLLLGTMFWSTVRPECTGRRSSWPSSLPGSSAPTSTRSTLDWKG